MVIDVCTYNGEKEMWDLRYNCLKDYVDFFIVCEARTTFSGQTKPLYFTELKTKYNNTFHWIIDENWTEEEKQQAWASPNTGGAAHWTREFLQKESIKKALANMNPRDSDTIFVGDVDEIWNPTALRLVGPYKLKLLVYTYYLNNRSSEEFWGTLKADYGTIKNMCLNHLRTRAPRTKNYFGWHFTSMGGTEFLMRKLTDSYTQESYATPQVLNNLSYNIEHNQDFLGRDFTYKLDESNWPEYLVNNRETYKALCKNSSELKIGKSNESGVNETLNDPEN